MIHPDYKAYGLDQIDSSAAADNAAKFMGILGFIGAAIGEAYRDAFIKEDIEAVVKTFNNFPLVITFLDYDDEDMDRHTYRRHYTVRQIACEITGWKHYKVGDLAAMTTLDELREYFSNVVESGSGYVAAFRTAEEQEHFESEQRRQYLEKAARGFARECSASIGTLEFIREIEKALERLAYRRERWNDGETRMEEFAAHRFAGGGNETYFDDLNYVNSNLSTERTDLEGIIDWLRGECPLLMAKYEEMKLSGKWAEEMSDI